MEKRGRECTNVEDVFVVGLRIIGKNIVLSISAWCVSFVAKVDNLLNTAMQ